MKYSPLQSNAERCLCKTTRYWFRYRIKAADAMRRVIQDKYPLLSRKKDFQDSCPHSTDFKESLYWKGKDILTRDHTAFCVYKLSLTSPTSGGRSVGRIERSRTKATEHVR
jgi:hypothetical protein